MPEIMSGEQQSLVSHQRTLGLVRSLGARIAFPGHGTPFEDLEARIQSIRDHHAGRTKQLLKMLMRHETSAEKGTGMTQFMAATKLYGPLSGLNIFFGVSSASGYLAALEEEGLATRCKEGA